MQNYYHRYATAHHIDMHQNAYRYHVFAYRYVDKDTSVFVKIKMLDAYNNFADIAANVSCPGR